MKLYIFSQYGHLNFPSGVLWISRSTSVLGATQSLEDGDVLLGAMATGDREGATDDTADDVTVGFEADVMTGSDVIEGGGGGEVMTGSECSGRDVIGWRFRGRDM